MCVCVCVFGYLLSFEFDRYSCSLGASEILGFSRRECEAPPILLTFRRRIKSHLPFAGIIRRLSYSTRFHDKG